PIGNSPGFPNSANLSPQVWAGGDRVEFVGHPAMLRGAVEDDRWPGTALSSSWSQVSGPGTAQFSEATVDSVVANFSIAGRYRIRLLATDGALAASDVATIDVVARPF